MIGWFPLIYVPLVQVDVTGEITVGGGISLTFSRQVSHSVSSKIEWTDTSGGEATHSVC